MDPPYPHESKRLVEITEDPLVEIREGQDTFSIAPDMLLRKNVYVLQVKGNSMMGDHLFEGDHVIVEKSHTAKDGELVVALLGDNRATLKRFRREGCQIRLEHTDSSSEAMIFDEKEVAIQGVVIGILRKYRG